MDEVEKARKMLERDLEDYPLALHDPISDARTFRKIQQYLFSCIITGKNRADSKDELYRVYETQTDEEKAIFTSKVDLLANTLYDFYSFLKTREKE